MTNDRPTSSIDLSAIQAKVAQVTSAMENRVIGQRAVVERLLVSLIAGGHVLLEGMPGLAKTTAIKALSDCSDLQMSRIQFTPDLLPADVIGTQIYNPREMQFTVKQGPIFANLLIADEINRAPAKVQSALLEAMQEKQVTIGDQTFLLPKPFLVMATQNPIEQEGTYPLPEAQTDRFLFKLKVTYPTPDHEKEIVRRMSLGDEIPLDKVLTQSDVFAMREVLRHVYVSEKIHQYIVNLVFASRFPEKFGLTKLKNLIAFGASPRASMSLDLASRVLALFDGRDFVTPQDIKDIAPDILRHRIMATYEAEADDMTTDDIIKTILDHIDVP
jgi:MoxR-like ATPase